MRLDKLRPEDLEAGIIILAGVIIGALTMFYILNGGGGQSLLYSGAECVIDDAGTFEKLLSTSDKPVAAMFSSDTCPVCREMEPHWISLCQGDGEAVEYVVVKLSHSTIELFQRYGVTETPTFILFTNGTPTLYHVGGFPGPQVEEEMREWAVAGIPAKNQVYQLMIEECSSCHTLPSGTDYESIAEWVNASQHESLASLVATAAMHNMSVSQLYQDGIRGLTQVILNMSPGLSEEEAYKLAVLLDNMAYTLAAGEDGGQASDTAQTEAPAVGEALGILAVFTAGLLAAFSPCVFPILITYTTTLATRENGRGTTGAPGAFRAFLAAAAGTLAIGVGFMVLGDAIQEASSLLLPTAALAIMSAGILGYMDVPTFVNIGISTRRGLTTFSFLYGVLALQCSFPLVAGALLLIAHGGVEQGLPALAAFTLGISIPVALAVYATGRDRIRAALGRMTGKKAQRYSHFFLAVVGLFLLLYSLGAL